MGDFSSEKNEYSKQITNSVHDFYKEPLKRKICDAGQVIADKTVATGNFPVFETNLQIKSPLIDSNVRELHRISKESDPNLAFEKRDLSYDRHRMPKSKEVPLTQDMF